MQFLHQMFNVSALLLDDGLLYCYRSRLVLNLVTALGLLQMF